MNEEEVKIKFVLPWLHQVGLDVQDFQLERSFSLKIGRQTITVGSTSERTIRGRFDILVRRGDKNLFVVETKASDELLTDADRDQAISYARLVHPIAPYAVLTNGHEYQIYHSISKERIQPADIHRYGYEASLPDGAIEEAQRYFFALNRANLARFCERQVTSEMRLVRGALTDGKKYVPELHVPRASFQGTLAQFYQSPTPGLLVSGESGAGKTCELCSFAETKIAAGQLALFFNGFTLHGDIFHALCAEFSWTFNDAEGPIRVLTRVESLIGGEELTIIIDAIDEWNSGTGAAQLGSLLRFAETRKIRLVASCKTSAVPRFVTHRDNPTHFGNLSRVATLSPLSEPEFYIAIEKYRRAYNFFGGFEVNVLKQARENPFFIRVLFDVARDSKFKHITYNSPQLFQRYYERSLGKLERAREGRETLLTIAQLLWDENADSASERDVKQALNLRPTEPILEELFGHGLLVRTAGDSTESRISFYFQQLRDYLIAFPVLRFSSISIDALSTEFRRISYPSMRGDVFALYYRLSPPERKRVIDGELYNNARTYLTLYVSATDTHFPALRTRLNPRTEQPIGFIGELLLGNGRVGAHGFRSLAPTDEDVYFFPTDQVLGTSNLATLEGARGGMHMRSSDNGFRNGMDVRSEVVDFELIPQLQSLIADGRLNETNNPELLVELVLDTVLGHVQFFSALLTPDRSAVAFPLKLSSVSRCLLRAKLTRHFEDELVKEKRRSGVIAEHWSGSYLTYSYQRTPEDNEVVASRVDRALAGGAMPQIRARYNEIETLAETLEPAIKALLCHGEHIESPPHFNLSRRISGTMQTTVTAIAELQTYLIDVYSTHFKSLRTLIQTNFPTLASTFESHSRPARTYFLLLGSPATSAFDWDLTIYSVLSQSGLNAVHVAVNIASLRPLRSGYVIDGVEYDEVSVTWSSVGDFLNGRMNFGSAHLRALVYAAISRDWPQAETRIRQILLTSTA